MQKWAVAEPDDCTHKLGSRFLQRIASDASLFISEDGIGRATAGIRGIWAVVGSMSLCPFVCLYPLWMGPEGIFFCSRHS